MQFGIPSARLPILSGVSTRLLLNSSVMHSVWPPVAGCYVLVGLPSWKPEKRAYGFVVRNFAVSVIALSASGEKRDRVRRPATATHLHRMQPG